jgi:hypothetical protein
MDDDRTMSYERLLGAPAGADLDEVQRCYRREMRRWHPDLPGGDAEHARRLNEARDELVADPPLPRRPAAPPTDFAPPAGAPVAPAPSPAVAPGSSGKTSSGGAGRSGFGLAGVMLLLGGLWVALLAIGLVGWFITGVLPAISAVLGAR